MRPTATRRTETDGDAEPNASTATDPSGEPDRNAGLLSLDLVAAVAVVAVSSLAVDPGTDVSVARALAGFAFPLVASGYVLVSALFPGRPRGTIRRVARSGGYSPDTAERLALAYGCSLALLPFAAVAYGLPGVTAAPAAGLSGLAVATTVVATVAFARRLALPREERYRAPSLITAVSKSGSDRDERTRSPRRRPRAERRADLRGGD